MSTELDRIKATLKELLSQSFAVHIDRKRGRVVIGGHEITRKQLREFLQALDSERAHA